MIETTFIAPVTVLVGLGFPRRIESVLDAISFLDEQPEMLRDEAFYATYDACRDALAGVESVADARDVFCALARRRGVLVEDGWSRSSADVLHGASA